MAQTETQKRKLALQPCLPSRLGAEPWIFFWHLNQKSQVKVNKLSKIKQTYTAESNTNWCLADFKAFVGLEGSLARAFFGLSLVGLMDRIYQNKRFIDISCIIPWDKNIIIIRIMNLDSPLLPSWPLCRGRRRGRGDFHPIERKASKKRSDESKGGMTYLSPLLSSSSLSSSSLSS